MSFQKIPLLNPQPAPALDNGFGNSVQLVTGEWIAADEIGVQLDTGERLALHCATGSRDYSTLNLTLHCTARMLGAEGGTAVDDGLQPAQIAVEWIHSASPAQIALAGGLDALRRDCLRLTLGEAPLATVDGVPVLNLPEFMRLQISIRTAIATAALLGSHADNPDPL